MNPARQDGACTAHVLQLEHAGAMQLLESQKRALEMELETMTAKYRAADDKCHEQRRKIAEQEEGMRQATVERDEAQLQLEETNATLASRDATIAEVCFEYALFSVWSQCASELCKCVFACAHSARFRAAAFS